MTIVARNQKGEVLLKLVTGPDLKLKIAIVSSRQDGSFYLKNIALVNYRYEME